VPSDTTPNIANPIMPSALINWYNNNSWPTLTSLNGNLDPTIVEETCSINFECRHDYIIRINPVSSAATAAASNLFQQSRLTLGKILI
jgi:hypothetical protein